MNNHATHWKSVAHQELHRRGFLSSIALASLLAEKYANGESGNSHFAGNAKNVIVIFCSGAISQVDTFDYNPELIRSHDKPMPGTEKLVSFQGPNGNLTKPCWKFRPRGKSGKMVSDLLPKIGAMSDEICFMHSMTKMSNTHGPAENIMNTGFTFDGFRAWAHG